MKVLFLTNSLKSYSNQRMIEEFKAKNIKMEIIEPLQSTIEIGSSVPYDAIFNRITKTSLDPIGEQYLHLYLKEQQINCFEGWNLTQDKVLQQIYLSQNQFHVLPSISLRGLPSEKHKELLTSWSLEFGEKFMVKTVYGNQGRGVNFVTGVECLISWLETFYWQKDQMYLIQPFLNADKEFRSFIIKGHPGIYLERKTLTSFKANFHQNGEAILIQPPKELIDLTEKILAQTKLNYCAIDWLMKNDRYYPIDINAVPGFEQLETISKINIAQKITEQLA